MLMLLWRCTAEFLLSGSPGSTFILVFQGLWKQLACLLVPLLSWKSLRWEGFSPAPVPGGSRSSSLCFAAQNTWQQIWFPGRFWLIQVRAGFHRAGQGHWMDSRAAPGWILLQIVEVLWGQTLGNRTKGLSSFLSFAQRTPEEEDGREKVKDPYGLRLFRDSPSSEVRCGMMEVIYGHTGFNPVV